MRPAVPEDGRQIYEWFAHSETTPSMIGPPVFPDQPVPAWEDFIADYPSYYFDGSEPMLGRSFVILVDEVPVGQVNYNKIDTKRRRVEVDIWLNAENRTGRGFGPDALEALTEYMYREFGLTQFVIRPSARNTRAIRAYEKAGFQQSPVTHAEAVSTFGPADYPDDIVLIKYLEPAA